MSLIQKNFLGNNIINVNQSRKLSDDDKEKLLNKINEMNVKSAVIRYENGGETQEFSQMVGSFLEFNNINVNLMPVMMSEIVRNEFSIISHPSAANSVMIKIGPIS